MTAVRITGAARAGEVAAVLAVLARDAGAAPQAGGYDRWRQQRLRALGRVLDQPGDHRRGPRRGYDVG